MATERRRATDTGRIVLRNATVVTPQGVVPGGRVVVSGDRIVAVDAGTTTAGVRDAIDVGDRYVLPGLVDLHGDDVERHVHPRPGASVGLRTALESCERANLAAGVTTKFHAVAFETAAEDGRSIAGARELCEAIDAHSGPIDSRVHARCEVTDPDSVDAVRALARRGIPDVVSVMSHVPGEGQFDDEAGFVRRYGEDCRERRSDSAGGTTGEELRRRVREVATAARGAGAVVASHDDPSPSSVERACVDGATICEYPLSLPAAERARELGMITAMGAPNLARGGSLYDNLAAIDAVDARVLDALCSDYHPPSLLAAAFFDTDEPLPARVRRVTEVPARVAGFPDRGRLEAGARADLVVVDPDPVPTVTRTFVAGREVYRVGQETEASGEHPDHLSSN